MSSAYFPQSNGPAEVAVKKAKRMLMGNVGTTGSLNNDGLLRALLQARNTPDPDCNISPAQVVFGRPSRVAFSFTSRCIKYNNPSIRPTWREAWSQKEDAIGLYRENVIAVRVIDRSAYDATSRVHAHRQRENLSYLRNGCCIYYLRPSGAAHL